MKNDSSLLWNTNTPLVMTTAQNLLQQLRHPSVVEKSGSVCVATTNKNSIPKNVMYVDLVLNVSTAYLSETGVTHAAKQLVSTGCITK